ncbi:hypothetical protein FEI17_27365 (plasmid) [Kosakonia radicincitans]|uniref:hypothetical protein n=1 Tax=Kosakonia radicincitans TaxID=283686 RepID=UPI0011EBC305|nr:hypothetical protein [Kosakonia radicincitans]QEM94346.1 hypothetical protein FEI17_27365 [Kosakonia radicincitans]
MTQSTDLSNTGLSGLWDELSDEQRIWFHTTTNFGYPLFHVLDHEGKELARWINSTEQWEIRANSPERWYPLPEMATEITVGETRTIILLGISVFRYFRAD